MADEQTPEIATPAGPPTEATPGPDGTEATTPEPATTEPAKTEAKITPETYGEFALPEGMPVDGPLLDQFKAVAAETGLSQEQAQKLVELHARSVQGHMEAHAAAVKGWTEAAKADKEIGGDRYEETRHVVGTVLATFGSPELIALLDGTGLGEHPDVIRFTARVGKAMLEDGPAKVRQPDAGPRDHAKILYPDMN